MLAFHYRRFLLTPLHRKRRVCDDEGDDDKTLSKLRLLSLLLARLAGAADEEESEQQPQQGVTMISSVDFFLAFFFSICNDVFCWPGSPLFGTFGGIRCMGTRLPPSSSGWFYLLDPCKCPPMLVVFAGAPLTGKVALKLYQSP